MGRYSHFSGGVTGVAIPVVEEGLLDSSLLLSSKIQSFSIEGLQSLPLEIRGASPTDSPWDADVSSAFSAISPICIF